MGKNGHKINIEMQNIDLDGFYKLVPYYILHLSAQQISQTNGYWLLNHIITIFTLNYKFKPEKFNSAFRILIID